MVKTDYDEIEYLSRPFRQTHPDRLAAHAILFGMNPTDPTKCRYLDVGCGSGGNIIPMAALMPDASFFGFDLAPTAIAQAKQRASEIGLSNIRLEAIDLLDFPEDAGQFDYIVAHGFYSWVPDAVRERFWTLLEKHLSPNGVAYVSFNAYPGSMIRHIWRDAAAFHSQGIEDLNERAAKGCEMVAMMAGASTKRGPWEKIIDEMNSAIKTKGIGWVSHDDFGPFFQPYYFHQVAEAAGQHGFQYLSEAVYYDMQPHEISQNAQPILEQLARTSVILREQYFDFLELRPFRQILLCRSNQPVRRPPALDGLRKLSFSSPAEKSGVSSDGNATYKNPLTNIEGAVPPAYHEILDQLKSAWPCSLPFDRIGAAGADRFKVAEILHQLWAGSLLEAHATPQLCGSGTEERPEVWKVARVEAAAGQPVTTRIHTQIQLDDISNQLVATLDGTRGRAGLAARFDELNKRLDWLANMGLLNPGHS
jgi:SAM-dependent methyltransferase